MIFTPEPAYDFSPIRPGEIPLWQLVIAQLAIDFRQAGHFHLDDPRMELLVTACRIHNGGMPQSEPTLAVCLDADRLDLGRVGIIPDPLRLSTLTAKSIAESQPSHILHSSAVDVFSDWNSCGQGDLKN